MNAILAIPIGLRLIILAIIGAVLGTAINWAVYRFSYSPRPISPWLPPRPDAPPRRWSDRLPLVGWIGLRREWRLHGTGFWIRPLLVELCCCAGLAVLYWWEVESQELLLAPLRVPMFGARGAAAVDTLATLHLVFIAHAILIAFMLAASLIDIDERLIPDEVTVPGTLIGLLLAAVVPWSLLPIMHRAPMGPLGLGPPDLRFLTFTSTNFWPWPGEMIGAPDIRSLAIGLCCVWLWSVGLMPRVWYSRHGFGRAWRIFWSRLLRERLTLWALLIGIVVSLGTFAVWRHGGAHWRGLLSALIGMATGGFLIWILRIIGKAILGREAMGFGDVTLMAMIGAFLGWQACLVIFFLAPIAGAAIGLTQLLAHRQNEIRFGPFLSLAAVVTIVRWSTIWQSLGDVFAGGWRVPAVIAVCVLLIAPLLILVRLGGDLLRRILPS